MKTFNSVNDILDFAIKAEQEAVDFYSNLSEQSKSPAMKEVFLEYAGEEMKHKSKLLGIKENNAFALPVEKVKDLKIADYLVDVKPNPKMTYQEALILAMKKEKKAFILYTHLAEKATDPAIKVLFQSLALEESRHKLRFEIEYDDYILKEN